MHDHDIALMGIRMENTDIEHLMQIIVNNAAGDILDINVPGIVDGSYYYYFATLADYADADVAKYAETEEKKQRFTNLFRTYRVSDLQDSV